MKRDFVVKAKTYIIVTIESPRRYLDKEGRLTTFSALAAKFDTKKAAAMAYRNGHTAAACQIIEAKDWRQYA